MRGRCGAGFRGAWFREDLGVSAAQVVGVEGGGRVEVVLPDAQEGEGQGVFCGGLGEETRVECSEGFGDCGLADDDEVSRLLAECGEELVAAEEGFAEADAVQINARVELAAAGVEESVDAAASGRLGEMGKNGEAGDCDQRKTERVAQTLGGAEADADPGEGAGAVDYGNGFERLQAETGAGR